MPEGEWGGLWESHGALTANGNVWACSGMSVPVSTVLSPPPRHIAELIFYMEELRAHVRKYGPVMQRYYVQYLSGFDAVVLNELVQVSLGLRFPRGDF